MAEGPERIPAGSVENAMRTLQLLRDWGSLRVSDVARELSVARSTAHRLMSQLSAYGVVEQEPDGPRYHAGPLLAELGLATFRSRDLVEQMHPHLQRLSDEVNETVHLIALEGRDAVLHRQRRVARPGAPGRGPGGHRLPGLRELRRQGAAGAAERRCRAAPVRRHGVRLNQPDHLEPGSADRRATPDTRPWLCHHLGDRELGLAALAVVQRSRDGVPMAAIAIAVPEQRLPPARLEALVKALRATTEQAAGQLL